MHYPSNCSEKALTASPRSSLDVTVVTLSSLLRMEGPNLHWIVTNMQINKTVVCVFYQLISTYNRGILSLIKKVPVKYRDHGEGIASHLILYSMVQSFFHTSERPCSWSDEVVTHLLFCSNPSHGWDSLRQAVKNLFKSNLFHSGGPVKKHQPQKSLPPA